MTRAAPPAGDVVQLELLSALPGVRHGFATRRGRLQGVVPEPVARLQQVHGAEVLELPIEPARRTPFLQPAVEQRPAADALHTDQPLATVAVAVADCMPILIADPRTGAVAAVHAGWRGLAAGVVENTVAALRAHYGSAATDLVVGIGPAIGPCCFEVGPEVIEAFAARGYGDQARAPGNGARPHADLRAVAAAILSRLGVAPDRLAITEVCTRCNSDWLWSYRKDGARAGRMICGIARLG